MVNVIKSIVYPYASGAWAIHVIASVIVNHADLIRQW